MVNFVRNPLNYIFLLICICIFCFQVRHLENLKDFGECVIMLQKSVVKKFLQGFMAPKQKKKKKQTGEESGKTEEVDEEKKLAEEARVSVCVCSLCENRFFCVYTFYSG